MLAYTKSLITFLTSLTFIFLLYLFCPSLTLAQTGIHTSYGHLNPYYCQLSQGLPTTFLINIEADIPELTEYLNCYQNSSLLIIRVTHLFSTTNPAIIQAAAYRIATTFAPVADRTYVVFGNELNNLAAEYKCLGSLPSCGSTYASQFSSFYTTLKATNSTIQVAASPLDLINSDYDAYPFFVGAFSAYTSSDFYAANSYTTNGVCKYESLRCQADSWKWYSQKTGSDKPVILTEFGIAPGLDPTLDEQLAFILTAPTSVLATTPLVLNTCSSGTGEWLLYSSGKLYDVNGQRVDPLTCIPQDEQLGDCQDSSIEKYPLRPYPGNPCRSDPRPGPLMCANRPLPIGIQSYTATCGGAGNCDFEVPPTTFVGSFQVLINRQAQIPYTSFAEYDRPDYSPSYRDNKGNYIADLLSGSGSVFYDTQPLRSADSLTPAPQDILDHSAAWQKLTPYTYQNDTKQELISRIRGVVSPVHNYIATYLDALGRPIPRETITSLGDPERAARRIQDITPPPIKPTNTCQFTGNVIAFGACYSQYQADLIAWKLQSDQNLWKYVPAFTLEDTAGTATLVLGNDYDTQKVYTPHVRRIRDAAREIKSILSPL